MKFYPREGLNTLYIGMNVLDAPWDNEKVRQAIAQGIDREQIVKNFYPEGSEVGDPLHAVRDPLRMRRRRHLDGFDAAAAKQLLTDAELRTSARPTDLLPQGGPRLPPGSAADRHRDQEPARGQPRDQDDPGPPGVGCVPRRRQPQASSTACSCSAGAPTIPTSTNFLDYHFGSGSGKKFGKPFDDIVAALNKGGQSADDAVRKAAYTEANNLIKQHVPRSSWPTVAPARPSRPTSQGAHSSPLGNEILRGDEGGRPRHAGLDAERRAAQPVLRRRDRWRDAPRLRADRRVAVRLRDGGTAAIPALATECKPNAELTTWTCTLRDGVTFADGATFDANDVVATYAAQWDTEEPEPRRPHQCVRVLPRPVRGLPQPAAPAS